MSMRTRIILCVVSGTIVALVFYLVRGLFPQHAVLLGLAVGALTYSLLRAVDNLRRGPGHGSPWHESDSGDEEQVNESSERPASQ